MFEKLVIGSGMVLGILFVALLSLVIHVDLPPMLILWIGLLSIPGLFIGVASWTKFLGGDDE